MNHMKDRKPSRPDIQEILSRMKSRFLNEEDSDSEDHAAGVNVVTTSVVESSIKVNDIEKSPDDEIADLMLKLNGQVDEELVASIRSRKKLYENHSEIDSTSSTTVNSTETEESVQKPRIILTLRPNENKPDTYVSSSNLTDYKGNSPKRKKQVNVKTETVPLKRSSRRSNDSNQSVLKSAIARKERTFSIDVNSKKRLPKKIKKEPKDIANVVNVESTVEDSSLDVKNVQIKEERTEENFEDNISEQKKKKKKLFKGGRYNIFKKKPLLKERQKAVKKGIFYQINSDLDTSETNSERHSTSVCSDMGTLLSSDRTYQDDMDTSLSNIDIEDRMNDNGLRTQDNEFNVCLCYEHIQVIVVDEGKLICKAVDCVEGKLLACERLAYHLDDYGNMPMFRANIALPFSTFCAHHMKRFFLHHSCPRCGRFCSDGIFMVCKNNHFFHIGCYHKDKGCLHCGSTDVYDLELRRYIVQHSKIKHFKKEYTSNITVNLGKFKLSTLNCPPKVDATKLSKYLQHINNEINNSKRILYPVQGLYQACESNDVKKVLSILGSGCNPSYQFSSKNNRTALHIACSQGNLMLVFILLQAGVDPNQVDDKMKTPMRMAAKAGHSDIVEYLLSKNGASEIKDAQGMTSLHLAAKNGKLKCCQIISNRRSSMVNWKDNGGWTPLVWACENSHTDVVKFFITLNPDTRISDDENNVALHWAAISGCLGVVQSLVEYDSEVNMLNDASDTALHIAARKNATDIVSFLLEKGAMAWHRNKWKKRPEDYCLPNSPCYNLFNDVPPEQCKPVSDIKPLLMIDSECAEPKLETPTVFVKTTPVLVSEDITHGCEDVPIRCVNEIDDEVPIEFTYIKENCYDVGNYVDSAMSHIASCNCEGACNTSACKCVQANGDCLYDENGRLNSDFDYFNPSVILYECNLRCRCHKQRCGNRVIQKGIKVELELFRHEGMGWGVRTRQPIPKGTFVCEYVGEIITDQKANDLKEDSYLFNLENPGATELYCIDAFNYSNVSRFINHSCDPNLMSVRSFINHHDKRFPRIAFFAVQDIEEFEPLSYDYGTAFWKVKGKLFTCNCGKANCSFSEEALKNLHIDSDNEELEELEEIDENIEQNLTEINELSGDESSNQDTKVTNKIDNSLFQKTRSSVGNSLSKRNNVRSSISFNICTSTTVNGSKKTRLSKNSAHSSPSSTVCSSVTTNNILKNSSIKSKNASRQNNGFLGKNKTVRFKVFKKKMPNKTVSKQFIKISDSRSKLIENKLQPVKLKKKLAEKILNRKSSPAIGKKVVVTTVTRKKSSTDETKKRKMCNGDKVSSGSIQLTNKKVVTTYVLRPDVSSSSKEISVSSKMENAGVSKGNVLRSRNSGIKEATNVSLEISNNDETAQNSKDIIRLTTHIKNEPIDDSTHNASVEQLESELDIVNGEKCLSEDYLETSSTFEEKYKDVNLSDSLNFNNSFQESDYNINSDGWSSPGSLDEML